MPRTSPKVTLREHLDTIDQNSVAGINNFKSLTRRLKKIFVNSGYKHSAKVPHLVEQYIHMIFETQDYRCTHWLEVESGELNGVWNRPGYNYNSWKRKELKFKKRAYHNINYFNNKIYVLGGKGLSANKKKEYLNNTIEIYDIKNDSKLLTKQTHTKLLTSRLLAIIITL